VSYVCDGKIAPLPSNVNDFDIVDTYMLLEMSINLLVNGWSFVKKSRWVAFNVSVSS
jgi:hypothetical protein